MRNRYLPLVWTLAFVIYGRVELQAEDLSEEIHQTYPLEAKGSISLDNVNGKVQIEAWDRNEVELTAVKRAKKAEHLKDVSIDVNAQADRIRIKTKYPDSRGNRNNSTSVQYHLKVPVTARLEKVSNINGPVLVEGVKGDIKAESVNGDVVIKRLEGAADLSTVNGQAKAEVDKLQKDKSISMETVNGSVTLTLPSNSNAHVKANTVHGSLKTDFPITVKKHFPIGQDFSGKLGEGGTSIKLSTVNGGISLKERQEKLSKN